MPGVPCWAWAVEDGLEACRRCALLEDLCCQVRELWEAVTRVHSIRDDEKEINRTLSETSQIQEPNFPTALKEGQAEFLPISGLEVEIPRVAKVGCDFWHQGRGWLLLHLKVCNYGIDSEPW